MRFLRHENRRLVFELRQRDRDLLSGLLGLYPVMPAGQVQFTRAAEVDPEGERQQLLEEALAAQRKENRSRIEAFLAAGPRFELHDTQMLLRITQGEADWLLEVLNEIRVGSWVRLGRPAAGAKARVALNAESLRYLWAMELSGYLETQLLDGLTTQP